MKENYRQRGTWSLLLNLLMFLTVSWSVLHMVWYRGEGNMQVSGAWAFIYFTVDSNIFCALACLILAVFRMLKRKLPYGLLILKYVGTTAVTVTLMTVLLFLGPVFGYAGMFAGNNIFLHLISPLAAIFSFILLDDERKIGRKFTWLSVLPTLLYAFVYLYEAIYLGPEKGGWNDFYGFNMGGFWYISFVAMLAATGLFGFTLRILHNRFLPENSFDR